MQSLVKSEYMFEHFSRIANSYGNLRTTDEAPIQSIQDKLNSGKLQGADIGCGDGRYDLKLLQRMKKLFLYCIDNNPQMLKYLQLSLNEQNIRNFKTKQSISEQLPLYHNTMDCVLTFNAIHHFNIINFLNETSRVLKKEGLLFIYTRTRSQNSRNIWGKFFPHFTKKETRLYELDELKSIIDKIPCMHFDHIKYFKYERSSTIDRLAELAKNYHYSTFRFYTPDQLRKSIIEFKRKIVENYKDLENIRWHDENVMLVLKKK